MKTDSLKSIVAVTAFFWLGAAQAAGGLQLSNQVFQVVDIKTADGRTERKTVPAATVVPGTEVLYVISYRNAGDKPAESIAITNPVPAELEYVAALGPGPASQVSVDGGANYGALTSFTVTGADGEPRAAQAADVTHVRWTLNTAVTPGDGSSVSFKARLK